MACTTLPHIRCKILCTMLWCKLSPKDLHCARVALSYLLYLLLDIVIVAIAVAVARENSFHPLVFIILLPFYRFIFYFLPPATFHLHHQRLLLLLLALSYCAVALLQRLGCKDTLISLAYICIIYCCWFWGVMRLRLLVFHHFF